MKVAQLDPVNDRGRAGMRRFLKRKMRRAERRARRGGADDLQRSYAGYSS